jgi:hypothetical protein
MVRTPGRKAVKTVNFTTRLSERAARLLEEMQVRVAAAQDRAEASKSDVIEVALVELSRNKKYGKVERQQD